MPRVSKGGKKSNNKQSKATIDTTTDSSKSKALFKDNTSSPSNVVKTTKRKLDAPKYTRVTNEHVDDYPDFLFFKSKSSIPVSDGSLGKYNCDQCTYTCNELHDLEKHLKLECKPNIHYRDIYDYDPQTFGINIFGGLTAGDIYLVQNNFEDTDHKTLLKIGGTASIPTRITQYRVANGYEPRLICYFPVKNWREAEKLIEKELAPFNINGEIYKGSIEFLRDVVHGVLKTAYNKDFHEYEPSIKYNDVCQCNICDIVFKTAWAYQKHYLLCEQINSSKYASKFIHCKFCGFDVSKLEFGLDFHYDDKCNALDTMLYIQQNEQKVMFQQMRYEFKKMIDVEIPNFSDIDISSPDNIEMIINSYVKIIPTMKMIVRSELQKDMILSTTHSSTAVSTGIMNILSIFKNPIYFRMLDSDYFPNDNDRHCIHCFEEFNSKSDLIFHMDGCLMEEYMWTRKRIEKTVLKRIITDVWIEIVLCIRTNKDVSNLIPTINLICDVPKSIQNINRELILSHSNIRNCITCEYCDLLCDDEIDLHDHQSMRCKVKSILDFSSRAFKIHSEH